MEAVRFSGAVKARKVVWSRRWCIQRIVVEVLPLRVSRSTQERLRVERLQSAGRRQYGSSSPALLWNRRAPGESGSVRHDQRGRQKREVQAALWDHERRAFATGRLATWVSSDAGGDGSHGRVLETSVAHLGGAIRVAAGQPDASPGPTGTDV